MNRVRQVQKTWILILMFSILIPVCTAWFANDPASASLESAPSSINLSEVTLPQNSSYVTEGYDGGVLHVDTSDSSVACASADSQNRVVVTAVSTGSTTVTFWYRRSVSGNWVSAVLPVKVSAETSSSATLSPSDTGIVFSQSTIQINRGSSYTPEKIKINGSVRNASGFLWVSSSDAVASADKTTGLISGVSAGTAAVYAIDPETKCCGALTVQVS